MLAEANDGYLPLGRRMAASVSDVDVTELKLMILAVLERHGMGPEWRRSVRGGQLGAMLDQCGGARQVLAEALAAVRRPNGK